MTYYRVAAFVNGDWVSASNVRWGSREAAAAYALAELSFPWAVTVHEEEDGSVS